jgi:hypothetical protein
LIFAKKPGLAGFFNVENFTAFVVSALGAGAMRHLLLVTVRAFGKAMAFESVVGAPCRGALLGVSSFWIRHGSKFLLAEYVVKKLFAIGRQLSA